MTAPGNRTIFRVALAQMRSSRRPHVNVDTVTRLVTEAKAGGAAVIATGRSDYPNQVNNVLAFPGIFRGALDVRASDINDEMKIAAAYAIAGLVSDEELNEDYIIPAAFDPRVKDSVAEAVADAAIRSGVAHLPRSGSAPEWE